MEIPIFFASVRTKRLFSVLVFYIVLGTFRSAREFFNFLDPTRPQKETQLASECKFCRSVRKTEERRFAFGD